MLAQHSQSHFTHSSYCCGNQHLLEMFAEGNPTHPPQCSAQPCSSRASYGPLSLQIQHGTFEIQETSQSRSRERTWREENPRAVELYSTELNLPSGSGCPNFTSTVISMSLSPQLGTWVKIGENVGTARDNWGQVGAIRDILEAFPLSPAWPGVVPRNCPGFHTSTIVVSSRWHHVVGAAWTGHWVFGVGAKELCVL